MTSDQVTRFKCVCFCRNLADILCEIGGTKKHRDLSDKEYFERCLLSCVPDYVFHLAKYMVSKQIRGNPSAVT